MWSHGGFSPSDPSAPSLSQSDLRWHDVPQLGDNVGTPLAMDERKEENGPLLSEVQSGVRHVLKRPGGLGLSAPAREGLRAIVEQPQHPRVDDTSTDAADIS